MDDSKSTPPSMPSKSGLGYSRVSKNKDCLILGYTEIEIFTFFVSAKFFFKEICPFMKKYISIVSL